MRITWSDFRALVDSGKVWKDIDGEWYAEPGVFDDVDIEIECPLPFEHVAPTVQIRCGSTLCGTGT